MVFNEKFTNLFCFLHVLPQFNVENFEHATKNGVSREKFCSFGFQHWRGGGGIRVQEVSRNLKVHKACNSYQLISMFVKLLRRSSLQNSRFSDYNHSTGFCLSFLDLFEKNLVSLSGKEEMTFWQPNQIQPSYILVKTGPYSHQKGKP